MQRVGARELAEVEGAADSRDPKLKNTLNRNAETSGGVFRVRTIAGSIEINQTSCGSQRALVALASHGAGDRTELRG